MRRAKTGCEGTSLDTHCDRLWPRFEGFLRESAWLISCIIQVSGSFMSTI